MLWPTDLSILKTQLETEAGETSGLEGLVSRRVQALLIDGPLKGLNARQQQQSHFWVMGLRELANKKQLEPRWAELADWESQLRQLHQQSCEAGGPLMRGVRAEKGYNGPFFLEIRPDIQFLRGTQDWSELLSGIGWWSEKPKPGGDYLAALVPSAGRFTGIHIMHSDMIEVLDLFQDGPREESQVPQSARAKHAAHRLIRLEVLRRIPQEDWRILHNEVCAKGEASYLESGLLVTTAVGHLARGNCCMSMCRHCPWGYVPF